MAHPVFGDWTRKGAAHLDDSGSALLFNAQ
jgi:hypothetical protein